MTRVHCEAVQPEFFKKGVGWFSHLSEYYETIFIRLGSIF